MAKYRIEISSSAEKQLKNLSRDVQIRISKAILELEMNPFPRGARKLSGYDNVFRIRIGTYRVLYSVAERKLIVIVLKVGHRKDIYR